MNKFMIGKGFFAALAISAAFNGQSTCAVETTLINNRNNNRKHIDDFHAIEEKFNEKFDEDFSQPGRKNYVAKTKYLTLHHGMGKDMEGFVKAGGPMEIEKKFLNQTHDAVNGLEKLHVDLSEYIRENPRKTIPYNELTSPDILMEQNHAKANEMLGCVVGELSRLRELKNGWTKWLNRESFQKIPK